MSADGGIAVESKRNRQPGAVTRFSPRFSSHDTLPPFLVGFRTGQTQGTVSYPVIACALLGGKDLSLISGSGHAAAFRFWSVLVACYLASSVWSFML